MTESSTRTNKGSVDSPYDYPLLTAEPVLTSPESELGREGAAIIHNLPSSGETVSLADTEEFYPRLFPSNFARSSSEVLSAKPARRPLVSRVDDSRYTPASR